MVAKDHEKRQHMHLRPFLPSGSAPTPRWLQFWVLLLLVPASFALLKMPLPIAAIAVILTFGLPLAIWLALHVHEAHELPAQLPRAILAAACISVTGLGLVGLFAFSAALALATLAASAATVGLMSRLDRTPFRARPGDATAPTDKKPSETDGKPDPTSVVLTPDLVRKLSDAELCHAWRRSFVALQHAHDLHRRAQVVQTRQLLLDEVDARHPAGLQAWLGSGALASSGPDRFIGPTSNPEAA